MSISAGGRSGLLAAGVVAGLVAAVAPAQAYWGYYGYYGPRAYYAAPPAYYVPFYRPRTVYVAPPPAYVLPGPVYRAPRVTAVRPPLRPPVGRRVVHPAAARPPLCECPAVHATPRLGDLPGRVSPERGPGSAVPAAAASGSLPWVPRTPVPAAAPVVAAPSAPAVVPAPAAPAAETPGSGPSFTPLTGD